MSALEPGTAAGDGADDGALDIRSGGIVAVDTETLRQTAGRLRAEADTCEGVGDLLQRVARTLDQAGVWVRPPTGRAVEAVAQARRLAADLEAMADVYELAELAAASDVALAAGDVALAARLRAQASVTLMLHPELLPRLAAETMAWRTETTVGLHAQYLAPYSGVTAASLTSAVLATGFVSWVDRGAVPRGTTLHGAQAPVRIDVVGAGPATAPTSLVDVVDRIPQDEGQVRVERYTMPDGSRRFVAYIGGTRSTDLIAGNEPWDMASNVALYARNHSASYDAVSAALVDAGAQPGDTVDLSGHSQGAMDASFLALSGTYDVPLLVTFGDPVQADVGENTLSVAVRHRDDPVSALADGGFAAGVGAAGSFVATRDTPGTAATGAGLLGSHGIDSYRETAKLLDGSKDPRMGAVRGRLDELARATSVEVTEYRALRGSPVAVPAPEPVPLPQQFDALPTRPGATSTGGEE